MSGGEPSSIKQYVSCDLVNSFDCMLNYTTIFISGVIVLYQALYRKWRPKSFDDVVGQESVTKTLENEIESKRVSHAYLFIGSRGTGKTSCAKIFAKAVNCLSPENGNPCGKCEICKEIESESALDIVEIDAASNNGVDNIRSMREELTFSPTKCKYRVYIVDEVHMLSTGAFNAFLKVLEEPPEHVIFILATTELHKIPPTIISRCQRFNFSRISDENILKRITYICEQEDIKIDSESAKLIAHSADGAMRDALSILDQCANSCGNNITLNDTQKILGTTSDDDVQKIAESMLENNCSECLQLIDSAHRESKNMFKFCEKIMEHFRNIMIDVVQGSRSDIPLDRILEILDTLQIAYQNIGSGANPKLEMEITAVKLCSGKITKTVQPKVVQNDTSGKTSTIKSDNTVTPPPEVKSEKIISGDIEQFDAWEQILNELKNTKTLKSLYISLRDSVAYQNKNYILIDSKNALAFEMLKNSDYRIAIKTIIKNITGHQYSLGPYKPNPKSDKSGSKSVDPLDTLIDNAQKNGINVTLN